MQNVGVFHLSGVPANRNLVILTVQYVCSRRFDQNRHCFERLSMRVLSARTRRNMPETNF